MTIVEAARPRLIIIPGNPPIRLWDIRHRYPVRSRRLRRELGQITSIAVHHDGVWFPRGDRNFNGTTVDEDLARMDADYRAANERLHLSPARMPYHLMGSPNAMLYYTLDSRYIGAHVHRGNTAAIGVAGFGDFSRRWPSLELIMVYGGAAVIIWRGLWRKIPIRGHYMYPNNATVCPGERTYPGWAPLVRNIARGFAGF